MIRLQPSDDHGLMLDLIQIDGGTQSRATLNQHVVDDYAAAIKDGATFPPIVVFYDGKKHWLADGFHRFHAFQKLGRGTVAADVRQGTRRDAILHSVGANEAHGLRRTNDDKRRAVLTLLNDAEWAKWTDREIAAACRVDHKTVGKARSEVTGEIPSERTYTTKHGTVATMKTGGINAGRKVGGSETAEITAESLLAQAVEGGGEPQKAEQEITETKPIDTRTDEDREYDDIQKAWDVAGAIARTRFLQANSLGMASEGMDQSAVGANAGERHVDRSASRASSAVKVGATNSHSAPPSPLATEQTGAVPVLPAAPVAPPKALSKADQMRLLRPHCQHPGTDRCAGSGRNHCHACKKLIAEGEAA